MKIRVDIMGQGKIAFVVIVNEHGEKDLLPSWFPLAEARAKAHEWARFFKCSVSERVL